MITIDFINQIKKHYPKEIDQIIKNSEKTLIIKEKFDIAETIWTYKKKRNFRQMHICDKKKLSNFINKFFCTENERNAEFILLKIKENKNMIRPSISVDSKKKYIYQDFSSIPNTKEEDLLINKITFLSEIKIKTDIRSMYESTYTHAFAWSFKGKEEYKEKWSEKDLTPEQKILECMDKEYRNEIKGDSETVGLLVGLPISDIMADYILSSIDEEIRKIEGYLEKFDFYHFKDNYSFFFYTNDSIKVDNILTHITETFSKYKYSIRFEKNELDLKYSTDSEITLKEIESIKQKQESQIFNLWGDNFGFDVYSGELFEMGDLSVKEAEELELKINNSNKEEIAKILIENLDVIKKNLDNFIIELSNHHCNHPKINRILLKWVSDIIKNPYRIKNKDIFLSFKSAYESMLFDFQEKIQKQIETLTTKKETIELMLFRTICKLDTSDFLSNVLEKDFSSNALEKDDTYFDIF